MTGIFLYNFRKTLKYKIFYENSTNGSPSVILGRTDRATHNKMVNITFQNFFESAKEGPTDIHSQYTRTRATVILIY